MHTDIVKPEGIAGKASRKSNSRGKLVQLTLALAALNPFAPFSSGSARAQLGVTCGRPIQFGRVLNCAAGGKIGVSPTGTAITDGCISPLGTLKEAVCKLSATGVVTRSVQMSMRRTRFDLRTGTGLIGGANGAVRINDFNIHTPSGGPIYTFAPAFFLGTNLNVGIGGTITIAPNQNGGVYSGRVSLTVTFL